jgi:hypothetical protein
MKSKILLPTLYMSAFTISVTIVLAISNHYSNSQRAVAQSSSGKLSPTKWELTGMSLSELLNSGWQISGHSSSHAAFHVVNDDLFDKESYTFLLSKNGKHTMCFVENPRPPIANNSGCRRIN